MTVRVLLGSRVEGLGIEVLAFPDAVCPGLHVWEPARSHMR